jgi:hypothetical protein
VHWPLQCRLLHQRDLRFLNVDLFHHVLPEAHQEHVFLARLNAPAAVLDGAEGLQLMRSLVLRNLFEVVAPAQSGAFVHAAADARFRGGI